MKKFILSSLLFLLVGSCGGHIFATAHAETLATAAMSAVAQSPSRQDLVMTDAALETLRVTLAQLKQTIAQNPAILSENKRTALKSILGDTNTNLLAIHRMLAASVSAAPVATASPSIVSSVKPGAVNAPISQTGGQAGLTPASQSNNQPKSVLAGNNTITPAIAQISGHVPLSPAWMATFGIIAVVVISFFIWRSRRNKQAVQKSRPQSIVFESSVSVMPLPMSREQAEVDPRIATQREMPRSPMSSIVTPSSETS